MFFIPDVNDKDLNTIIFRECFMRHPEETWKKLCESKETEHAGVEAQFRAYEYVLSELVFRSTRWYNPRKKRGELAPQEVRDRVDEAADWVFENILERYKAGDTEVPLKLWETHLFPHRAGVYSFEDSRQATQRERAKELLALLDNERMDLWLEEVSKIRKMATTVKIYQCDSLVLEQSFPAR
jgi:asparagine synthetase B (glutamine-hydrolysing)